MNLMISKVDNLMLSNIYPPNYLYSIQYRERSIFIPPPKKRIISENVENQFKMTEIWDPHSVCLWREEVL